MNPKPPDREVRDEAVRRIYEGNAPQFRADDMWNQVADAIRGGRRAHTRPKRLTRVAVVASAACLIIAAIVVGVAQLTQQPAESIHLEVAGDQGTTTVSEDHPTVRYGDSGIVLDLGRADQIRLAEAWQQIADVMGVDAKTTWVSDFMFEFSPDGVLVALSVHVEPSPGIQWDAVWDGRTETGGTVLPDREVTVLASKTANEEYAGDGSLTGGLCPADVLPQVDEVGIAQIVAMFPQNSGRDLRVGWWDLEDTDTAYDQAYVWTGAAFERMSTWEQEPRSTASPSLVGLQVAVVDSGNVAGAPTRFYFPMAQESVQSVTPIPLEDVAFVEMQREEQGQVHQDGYTGERRILSPVADADAVKAVLLDFATAATRHGIKAGNSEAVVTDITVVIHLLDGTAVTYSSSRPLGVAGRMLAAPFTGQGAAALPATMPEDFGFVAAFDVYGKSVLDTFAGTFHQDMVQPQWSTATAEVRLTRSELEAAYAAFRQMDVLAYATDFTPQPSGGQTPYCEYYLRVRAGGTEKEIRWNDETTSNSPEATVLRNWFRGIQKLVRETPGFKALPQPRGGYD